MHLPRELEIREAMSETGVDLSLYGPSSEEDLEPEETLLEEQGESEYEGDVDDPCPLTAFYFLCTQQNGFQEIYCVIQFFWGAQTEA